MYELHVANKNYSSWSLRPWVLMRTLGIPFAEKSWLFAGDSNHARFRAFSPTGRVPCLHDGSAVIWDSLAIAEYLAERHPGVWSADSAARAWSRCAAAEMHSGFATLRTVCGMNCGTRVRLRDWPAALKAEIARLDELWSEGLARFGGPFLAGTAFGAVDAFFAPVAFRVQTYDIPLGPASAGYVGRLLSLPAMREWYQAALAETWRDAAHEAELQQFGDIVTDLRATA